MASGQSVRSFFTPAAKKCKYLEQTHQMADGIRPDQANMIKDSLNRGFYSMLNFVWTWLHIYVSVKSKFEPPPTPGIWLFWKLSFKFPPTRAKMPFKCPTLGSIQVIKCPTPGTFKNFPYYPLCRSSRSRVCRQDQTGDSRVAIDSRVFILIYSVTAL